MSMLSSMLGGVSTADVDAAIAAAADTLDIIDLSDDFIGGLASTGNLGNLGFRFAGGTAAQVDGEAGHPGILRRTTSASINTVAYTDLLVTTGAEPLLPAEDFDETWVFKLAQTDTDTEARFGLSTDWTSITSVNGIYIEKKAADTQFFGVCRAASTETPRTAALLTSDTDWHTFRVRRVDATTIGFTVDGGTEVTLTTNIPTVALIPGCHITNIAAADKTLYLDFFRLRVTGLGR